MESTGTLQPRMHADIERSGYYPALVADTLDTALAAEPVNAYVVHHEAAFDHDELRRHVTVLALTPSRLIVGHTDEHPADETSTTAYATSSTEAVRLERIDSVVVTRVAADPADAPLRRAGARVRTDHRVGCCRADRPRAGVVRRPGVRRRPRLHRHCEQRRPVAAGVRGRRRCRRRRAGPGVRARRCRARPPTGPAEAVRGGGAPRAELVFFSGTMDCGKSTLALQTDHNHSARGRVGAGLHLPRPRRSRCALEPARAARRPRSRSHDDARLLGGP